MGTWNLFDYPFLTRTNACALFGAGLCNALGLNNDVVKTVCVGGDEYTVYTTPIYGKGFAMRIFQNDDIVCALLGVCVNKVEYGEQDEYHAIVLMGFEIALSVLMRLFPDNFIDIRDMSGKGKFIQAQLDGNGHIDGILWKNVSSVSTGVEYDWMVPVYGVDTGTGRGLLPWDELYQAWLDDPDSTKF